MPTRWVTATLFCALFFLAACGGGEEAPTATIAATPAAPVAATATPAVTTSSSAAASTAPGAALTAEEAAAINSYRLRVVSTSKSARGADTVEVEGTFVKNPPAESLSVSYQEGAQSMNMVVVDGVRYMQAGDLWMQAPETNFSIGELTLMTPQAVIGLLERMELVGVEPVNGVEASHYRGGKEIIPVMGTAGDTLDVSQLEFAQLDIWVDQATGVVTRVQLAADDGAADTQSLDVTFDYYDFNAAIEIAAPAVPVAAPVTGDVPAGDVPNDVLSQLLGFRLLLPTGSSIEGGMGSSVVSVLTSYTVAEAQAMLEQTMPANGYTLATKAAAMPGQALYIFQQGAKVVSITVTDDGSGLARLQFVAGP